MQYFLSTHALCSLSRSVGTNDYLEWLEKLKCKELPMLLCLTHADKFYAEYMSDNGSLHPEESEMKGKIKEKLEVKVC